MMGHGSFEAGHLSFEAGHLSCRHKKSQHSGPDSFPMRYDVCKRKPK